MTPTLPPAWQALLKDELQKPYWCSLEQRLGAAYESGVVYPPAQQLFAAFERTPPTCVRAVILGQDPYHEPGQANGLAFSVSRGVNCRRRCRISIRNWKLISAFRRQKAEI